MIFESRVWKEDLSRRADRLARRTTQRRWPEATYASVEQDVMLAAYAMRKLMEAHKVSDETAATVVRVQSFARRGPSPTRSNWHRIDKHYDLAAPRPEELVVRDLCNQFVHSYVFVPELGDEGLRGLFVASDRQRSKRLVRITARDLVAIMRKFAADFPGRFEATWDDALDDYRVTTRTMP